MVLKFETRPDKNGNVYRVDLYTGKKLIRFDDFIGCPDVIVESRKDLQKIVAMASKAGYTV